MSLLQELRDLLALVAEIVLVRLGTEPDLLDLQLLLLLKSEPS
jgi:hypothetical protein